MSAWALRKKCTAESESGSLSVLSAYAQKNAVGDVGLVTVGPLDPEGTQGGVDQFGTGQSSSSHYTLTLQGDGAGLTVLLDGGGS